MNHTVTTRLPSRSRPALLREMIASPDLSFLMEAHDGLSAKIVEEAGFRGIWASGLTTSAALGLRDSNEASWTQVLDVLEYMADATALPILVDGDTGHGNFNNVRRFVRKLGERGIAGVCIEDKLFPKTNSFLGEEQPLADLDEFCGRIKAGKDSQTDDDFVLVARVEALISGRGMEEALRRAEAYHAAGADAILIHSKKAVANEILEFTARWGGRSPVVIVPTMYYATPTEAFRRAGVSTIIWANHILRASIVAMRETAAQIHEDESLVRVEGNVATVKDIFRIVGNAELEEAERRYLPAKPAARAIVLAASGGDLGGLTADQPKCMVDIRGQSLLQRLTGTLRESGVRDVTVVRGYRKETVAAPGIRTVDNDRFASTGEVFSLACARERIEGETVVAYGDVLFRRYILDSLLTSRADVVVAVDTLGGARGRDLVAADRRFSADYLEETPPRLLRVAAELPVEEVCGAWMGLVRFSARGAEWLREEIAAIEAEGLLETADMLLLLTRIAAKHPVRVKYFTGHWLDVNNVTDLAEARNFS
ncbi:phosphoenolpyruvate mutase [Roseomonas sp. CCTCC AB2023176]|uniref:phosphoenolpyruvate mutase n=1 Tax=Roseomonas sp. CCTCC AB2023176 TaxID=3342640 RepID=UPI0035E0F2E9